MKKTLRNLAIVAAILVLGAAGIVACARFGFLAPSDSDLTARYALPGSKYVTLDGQTIHYMDEGQGEAIVLIHGSFSSLLAWNEWAQVLKTHYRVIRFDDPPLGLSGPDPKNRYDTDRAMEIVDQLTTKLGVGQFFLVATSSGGVPGAAYAATHPERIKGLVLSDIAVDPAPRPRHYPLAFRLALMADPWFQNWHPHAFWRGILEANFSDPAKVTPALVRQWTDLNNRASTMAALHKSRASYSIFARTPSDLAHITAPTLILWGADDQDTPPQMAVTAMDLLASHEKTLTILPHCGHLPAIECGPQSAHVAERFLDGIAKTR